MISGLLTFVFFIRHLSQAFHTLLFLPSVTERAEWPSAGDMRVCRCRWPVEVLERLDVRCAGFVDLATDIFFLGEGDFRLPSMGGLGRLRSMLGSEMLTITLQRRENINYKMKIGRLACPGCCLLDRINGWVGVSVRLSLGPCLYSIKSPMPSQRPCQLVAAFRVAVAVVWVWRSWQAGKQAREQRWKVWW